MSRPCVDLEIGADVAGMMDLRNRGVPDPDRFPYVPYPRVEVGGDGRPRGFGFPSCQWEWEVLSQQQINVFLDFLTSGEASAVVYIRTYTDEGAGLGVMTERFQAIMSRPTEGNGKQQIEQSRMPIYSNVVIRFSHLVVT